MRYSFFVVILGITYKYYGFICALWIDTSVVCAHFRRWSVCVELYTLLPLFKKEEDFIICYFFPTFKNHYGFTSFTFHFIVKKTHYSNTRALLPNYQYFFALHFPLFNVKKKYIPYKWLTCTYALAESV